MYTVTVIQYWFIRKKVINFSYSKLVRYGVCCRKTVWLTSMFEFAKQSVSEENQILNIAWNVVKFINKSLKR